MQKFLQTDLMQNRNFVRLWAAQIGSAFGSRITRTVLPIIAILMVGASTTQIGILSVLGVTPGLFVAAFAGGMIDRGSKRNILIAADLVRAVAILAIPVSAWLGVLEICQLYAVITIVGIASAIFQIADNTYLPSLIAKKHLVSANSKLEATDSIAEATGPGIAGILVQLITAPMAMVIDAGTYLWSAFMLLRIDTPENPTEPKPKSDGLFSDAIAGFRVCMGHPTIKSLLVVNTLMNFFGGFFMTLYMVLGLTMLNLSPAVLGMVISVGGIGSFIGAMYAGKISNRLGIRRALLFTLIAGQVAGLLIPASLINPDYGVWFLVASQLFEDAFITIFFILALSLRQEIIPTDVLGRANATFHVVTHSLFPVGALIAGPLTIWIGFEATLWIAALGGLMTIPVLMLPQRPATL